MARGQRRGGQNDINKVNSQAIKNHNKTRSKIRGAFRRHDTGKLTNLQVFQFGTTWTVSYAKFHGEFKKHSFNAN